MNTIYSGVPGFLSVAEKSGPRMFQYEPENPEAVWMVLFSPNNAFNAPYALKFDGDITIAFGRETDKLRVTMKELTNVDKHNLNSSTSQVWVPKLGRLDVMVAPKGKTCLRCGKAAVVRLRSYPPGSTSDGPGDFCEKCLNTGDPIKGHGICHICREKRATHWLGATPYDGNQSKAHGRQFRTHSKCAANWRSFVPNPKLFKPKLEIICPSTQSV